MSFIGARKAVPLLRPVRFLALASACFCVASLALAACGSATSPKPTTSASSASAGFTGYDWLVVAIRHEGKVTRFRRGSTSTCGSRGTGDSSPTTPSTPTAEPSA